MQMLKIKEATIKALIVLIPTYSMAYFTEKMVWVVPTLAACGFFAGTISFSNEDARRLPEEIDQVKEEGFDSSTALDEDAGDG